jgi:peptidoglycan/LPS O-acetylase OafA/YrhL
MPDCALVVEPADTMQRRWIPFDGLRAVLVMAVMAHHVEWTLGDTTPIFEAGWLPVDGFFVLSGFLIANALLREFDARGTIDIAGFVARRLLRLYPALVTVLAVIGVLAVVADDRPFDDVWPSLASAASLGHNFNYRSVSPLLTEVGPYWSLGIELQFYVVFPIVALALLTVRASRRAWVVLLVAAIAMSATWRAALGVERFPDSYLWTHVRLDSITWGVLIALAAQWGLLGRIPPAAARAGAPAALAVLVGGYLTLGSFDARTYQWGITLAGIASAALVSSLLLAPRSAVSRIFAWRPLVWLGRRSYSAYLWHQTVFLFLMRHTASGPWSRPIAGFIATFVLADLTYRFVEQPGLAWSRRWSVAHRTVSPPSPTATTISTSALVQE